MRLTTGVAVGDTFGPAEPNMMRRKRQIDIQGSDNDDDQGPPERHSSHHAPRKQQDNNNDQHAQQDNDEDTIQFCGRQCERPMLEAGHQSQTPLHSDNKGNIFFPVSCLHLFKYIRYQNV